MSSFCATGMSGGDQAAVLYSDITMDKFHRTNSMAHVPDKNIIGAVFSVNHLLQSWSALATAHCDIVHCWDYRKRADSCYVGCQANPSVEPAHNGHCISNQPPLY